MIKIPSLSLYIHIPWCKKKCPYCDFNSYPTTGEIPEKKYIFHLLQDLKQNIQLIKNRTICSIYIGGGTPSLIHPKIIKKLLEDVKNIVPVLKNAEITIEMNPNIQEIKYIPDYCNAGINRISIGIQSFNKNLLKKIGRNYTDMEIYKIMNFIKNIPFINLNLDLMYGLPQQSINTGILDIEKTIQYNPTHISWYQLTIEPNTLFELNQPILPKENISWNIFKYGNQLLKKSGYQQYEISSFSKPGYQCKHNLNYWRYGDYLGIGCGAHSKITKKNGDIIRIIKKKQIFNFMNGEYIEKITFIKPEERAFEYFINHFRIFEPISKKHFSQLTGLNPIDIKNEINDAVLKKYLKKNHTHWETTKKGKLFLNNLLEIFIKNNINQS
ncbi:Heme chaperone HemW [Buchnera aphidicola (Eriosoma grossulariae)]|uniref:radical SAM family heme chaperone HemW n=1 Tax=Buchnera aphidicola TaxID=9 RepID=UPI003464930D